MQPESLLREQVQLRIDQGKLPDRAADRTWGGSGVNAACAVCDERIPKTMVELEVEFAPEGGRRPESGLAVYHVHVRCYALWMLVVRSGPSHG